MGEWRCLPGKPQSQISWEPLLQFIFRYDIISLDERDGAREDMEGVDWAVNYLHSLVIQFLQAFCHQIFQSGNLKLKLVFRWKEKKKLVCLQTELWSVASPRFWLKRKLMTFHSHICSGGAIALSAALKYPGECRCNYCSSDQFSVGTLGGCVALSCYLPGGGNPAVSIQGLETPILQVNDPHYCK